MLRQVRQEAGLTQVELAERLGERQGFVSSYERGERRLDVLEIRQLCEAVNVPFLEFMARLSQDLSNLNKTA